MVLNGTNVEDSIIVRQDVTLWELYIGGSKNTKRNTQTYQWPNS